VSGPNTAGWDLLDEQTVSMLRRVWERDADKTVFKVIRDTALSHAAAHQRSLQHADRRALDVWNDRANCQRISESDIRAFNDLSDLPGDVQGRLKYVREREGLVQFAVELGREREAARTAADEAAQS
jgi:hypothetical protein